MAKRVGIRAPKVTNDRVTKKSNMKNILLILLILIYGKTSAQNIKIVKKSIIFEKVYTTTTTNMSDFLTRNLSGVKNTVDFFKGDGYYTLRFLGGAKITNQALFYIDNWLSETFSFTETSNDTNW